tara:strand:- start:3189 stop:4607 length:1419 start_codon:yes stop_codon:yes gene_type:complete
MNFKAIFYYLSFFCFPISFLAFLNILYSSYFNYFLSIDSYTVTLLVSLFVGGLLFFFGKNSLKKIEFHEQIFLIILIYFIASIFISIPYLLSNYQISYVNSLFEAFSGLTGTGFSIFGNIKYLDPTLIIWRSSSQWIGGLYFLVFLILFFSNSQFGYKLNNLVFTSDKSLNPEGNIKKISLKIFFIYSLLSVLIFTLLSMSGIRLFNSLNLSMTIVSSGGFLPTNYLSDIIKTNYHQITLILCFFLSLLNIFLLINIFSQKRVIEKHYEDLLIIVQVFLFSIIFYFLIKNMSFFESLLIILSSMTTSGITISSTSDSFVFYFLVLSIMGGSMISSTSGIKFLRIYILLKGTFTETLKLVKPNIVTNSNILFSQSKINNDIVKLSFLVFISFFLSLFILSSLLMIDNISFENSFKLSILTITNTTSSSLHGLENFNFSNLLTSSKIFIIIFMLIGKIELISLFIIIKKIFFKN